MVADHQGRQHQIGIGTNVFKENCQGKFAMRRLLIAAALAAFLPCLAFAQGYPNKAITMVVPFAAGGTTDTLARIFAAALQQRLVDGCQGHGRSPH